MSEQTSVVDASPQDDRVPRHVAIIMDGNHRWAKQRRLPGAAGHRAGARNVRSIAEACADLGVTCLTLFAFSTENWQRPKKEVSELMEIFAEYLQKELQTMMENNVRFLVVGDRSGLPNFLQSPLVHALESTSSNTGLLLNLAVNYGGRAELVRAVKNICIKAKSGQLHEDQIDEALISHHTYTPDVPDPDLIIRTSGERRMSNFLIWQAAYSEYYFTEVLWPEFNKEDFYRALREFQQRDRRMGRTEHLKEIA